MALFGGGTCASVTKQCKLFGSTNQGAAMTCRWEGNRGSCVAPATRQISVVCPPTGLMSEQRRMAPCLLHSSWGMSTSTSTVDLYVNLYSPAATQKHAQQRKHKYKQSENNDKVVDTWNWSINTISYITSWWRGTVGRTSVSDWRTFPVLRSTCN